LLRILLWLEFEEYYYCGRSEGESVNFALMLYPGMQVADIFAQGLNIVHAGNDQRKAQVIARDVALQMK